MYVYYIRGTAELYNSISTCEKIKKNIFFLFFLYPGTMVFFYWGTHHCCVCTTVLGVHMYLWYI